MSADDEMSWHSDPRFLPNGDFDRFRPQFNPDGSINMSLPGCASCVRSDHQAMMVGVHGKCNDAFAANCGGATTRFMLD